MAYSEHTLTLCFSATDDGRRDLAIPLEQG